MTPSSHGVQAGRIGAPGPYRVRTDRNTCARDGQPGWLDLVTH